MKNLILFALLAILPLQGAFIGQFVGPYIGRAIDFVGRDIAHGPLAWTGFAGTAVLACKCKDNNIALAGIGIASLAYHLSIFKSWWWLREELRSYSNNNSDSNILKRTVWHNPGEGQLDTGEVIYTAYTLLLTNVQKSAFANHLRNKILKNNSTDKELQILENALAVLKEKIDQYSKYSNFYSILCHRVNQDVLKTDYLFENNLHVENSAMSLLLQEHMQGSFIANSFKIRWSHSPTLGIAVPWWYTWSHRIASQCIVKALYQYGRLKVIKRILEAHPHGNAQQHNVNMNVAGYVL